MDRKTLEARAQEIQSRVEALDSIEETEARTAEIESITEAQEAYEADVAKHNDEIAKREELRTRMAGNTKPRSAVYGTPAAKPEQPEIRKDEAALDIRAVASQFVKSEEFNEYRQYGVNQPGAGARMEFDGVEARALIGSGPIAGAVTSSAGVLSRPTRLDPVAQAEKRTLSLADLTTTIPVSTNAIEYVRYNNAANIGGDAKVVAEGAAKPETTFTWELIGDTVKTVAEWTDITRQALADEVQTQAIIREEMFYSLRYRMDADMLFGTGSSGTLKGLATYSGINTYDVGSGNTEAKVISLRKAKTLTRHKEVVSTVVVMNPDDWETVELSTDTTGQWRVTSNVQENLNPRIWGQTVVETDAIVAGKFFAGDFRRGARIYDRQQASLYITDSDGEKFRANILTMLAELRVGLGMIRPYAFVLGTFRGAV